MQFHLVEFGGLAHVQQWLPQRQPEPLCGRSLFCLSPTNRLRVGCHRAVNSRPMNITWYCAIALSTLLALVIEPRYTYPAGARKTLFSLQVVCLAFFWARMLLEAVASGVLVAPRSFLRSFWNWVEVTLNVFSILQVIPQTRHHRWMRSFSALRPVRCVLWIPALDALTVPVARASPYLFDLAFVFVVFAFWLAMIGTFRIGDRMAQQCFLTASVDPRVRDSLSWVGVSGNGSSDRFAPALWSAPETATAESRLLSLPFLLYNVSSKCGVGMTCPSVSYSAPDGIQATVQCLAAAHARTSRDVYYQFKNIGAALLVLLQVSMDDDWYAVLEDIMTVLGSGAALLPVTMALLSFAVYAMAHALIRSSYASFAQTVTPLHLESSPPAGELAALSGWSGAGPQPAVDDGHTRLSLRSGSLPCAAEVVPPRLTTTLDDLAAKYERRDACVQTGFCYRGQAARESTSSPRSSREFLASLRDRIVSEQSLKSGLNPFNEAKGVACSTDEQSDMNLSLEGPQSYPLMVADQIGSAGFAATALTSGFCASVPALELSTKVSWSAYISLPHARRRLAQVVCSRAFSAVLQVLMLANVCFFAVDFADLSRTRRHDLMRTTGAIAIFFLLPLVLRAAALGPLAVATDVWNYFDTAAAVSGILEFAAPSIFSHRVVCGVLRPLRLVHILKYVMPSLALRAVRVDLVWFTVLLSAFLVLYSLLGVQLFARSFALSTLSDLPGDFTTMWSALLAVFCAFTGANVNSVLTHVFAGGTIPTGALFFFSLTVWGAWVFSPLLLGVLVEGFKYALHAECEELAEETPPLLLLSSLPMPAQLSVAPEPVRVCAEGAATSASSAAKPDQHTPVHEPESVPLAQSSEEEANWPACQSSAHYNVISKLYHARFAMAGAPLHSYSWRHTYGRGATFFSLLPARHVLRRALLRLLCSAVYRVLATLCVLLGFVALFFERRHQTHSMDRKLRKINIAYVVLFWTEMVLKWVAYGVFCQPPDHFARVDTSDEPSASHRTRAHAAEGFAAPTYFCSPLNWIDFFANGLAFAGMFYTPLRVGRVIRTARLFTSQEWPNEIFNALMRTLTSVVRVLPFIAVAYALFAITGIQLFAGQLHTCSDPAVRTKAACEGAFATSEATYFGESTVMATRQWQPTAFRYDHFGHAMLSVLVVATSSNWTALMQEGMSVPADASRSALAYYHSAYHVIYFVAVVLLVRMVAHKCVTAVFAAHLSHELSRNAGEMGLSDPSVDFPRCPFSSERKVHRATTPDGERELVRMLRQQARDVYSNALESIAYVTAVKELFTPLPNACSTFVHSVLSYRVCQRGKPVADYVFAGYTLVHVGFMASRHHGERSWEKTMFNVLDYVGIGVYGLEALAHIMAYGGRHLLRRLCFIVDLVILAFLIVAVAAPGLSFFRAFVILRLIRLTGLDMTWQLFTQRWYFIINAVGLYVYVMMMFAVVGTLMFGRVGHSAYAAGNLPWPEGLSAKRNFSTVIGSLLVLFDCSTGDNWQLVMLACAQRGDTSTHAAVIYFVIFVVTVNLIVVPLLIAVVVEVFVSPAPHRVLHEFRSVRRTWAAQYGQATVAVPGADLLAKLPCFLSALTGIHVTQDASGQWQAVEDVEVLSFLLSSAIPTEADAALSVTYGNLVRGIVRRMTGDQLDSFGALSSFATSVPARGTESDVGSDVAGTLAEKFAKERRNRVFQSLAEQAPPTVPDAGEPVTFTTLYVGLHKDGSHQTIDAAAPIRSADVLVPRGAVSVPNTHLFLYNLPDEDPSKGGTDTLTQDTSSAHSTPATCPHEDALDQRWQ